MLDHTIKPMQEAPDARPVTAEAWAGSDRASMTLPELVALLGGSVDARRDMPQTRFPVRQLKAGETLHRAGDRFDAIYVVRSGFLKTVSVDRTGEEQVLAFPMGGDVIGLDGVDAERYASDVVALEASQVAVVSFARIARLGHEYPCIERLLYAAFRRLSPERSACQPFCDRSALSCSSRALAVASSLTECRA